jgi:hypothetical protein
MKKRLYNKYGAAIGDDVTDLERIMQDASNQATKYCLDNNLDLRDAHSVCVSMVDIMFSYNIIKDAIKLKKELYSVINETL